MSGYVRAYHRIIRTKNTVSSRPLVGLSPALSWRDRFQRDLHVLLEERKDFNKYDLDSGHTLLWLLPWTGKKNDGIPLYDCDPYFIEVSRRVRLLPSDDDNITYRKGTNPGMRVEEPHMNFHGNTGDPWTPTSKGQAVQIKEQGFDYRLLNDILLGADYERPPALEFREGEDGLMYVIAEALGRTRGKTRGLHRRIVPIPPEVTNRIGRGTMREELAERSRERIKLTDTVREKVLYATLNTLLLAGTDQETSDGEDQKKKDMTESRKEIRSQYLKAFKFSVDTSFFESLWESAKEEVSDEEAKRHWQTLLWEKAEQQFDDAQRHAPDSAVHYWRARSAARSMFNHQANRYLKQAEQASS